jgi:hypothetical protein
MIYRLIIKVDSMGPEGQSLASSYRTVDIRDDNLDRAMTAQGSYEFCEIIGCERIRTAEQHEKGKSDVP